MINVPIDYCGASQFGVTSCFVIVINKVGYSVEAQSLMFLQRPLQENSV